MKKIITTILLVLGLVVLVSCEPTVTETDTTKPVIMGADPVEIAFGTPFDPLAGVTATDDVDGTIAIKAANVTGTVNVNEAGVYTLTYKVKDAAGNEAVKTRKVTVLPKQETPPLGNLLGGDFESGTLAVGWATWHDAPAYDVEYDIVNGEFVIDIKTAPAADTQWWAVQLQYNLINLEKFESYTLKFDVKADAKRYMNHQIQGGGLPAPGKAYGENNFTEITTEWKTVEMDFFVKGDAENAQLQFSFGNFGEATEVPAEFRVVETKVYLDNIMIVEGPELENQAPEVTAANLVVKVGSPTPLKQGITVSDDFTIVEIADVLVVQTSPLPTSPLPLFNPASPVKGVYEFEVTATDGELTTKVTRTITVSEPWNRPIDLAITADGSWDVNGNKDVEGWFLRQVDGDYITGSQTDGVTKLVLDEIPDADYKAVFKVDFVQFFAGKYVISFDVKADLARDIRVAIENAGLEDSYRHIEATTEWTTITLTYEFENDQFNKAFEFMFGSLTTNRPGFDPSPYGAEDDILTTVYFRNFTVVYTELA